ncbi:XrtA/PEP-CTERM system TPR-repeat protein PrsT [Photobacterium nomapromontoriensis]|uniref:XrtA/PEP-CTERM system TPR-repeat protein PrsT n=1 Tax=Photobacterium nomapromontoriensis TaxID=2910237 RepID=UPI003D14EF12
MFNKIILVKAAAVFLSFTLLACNSESPEFHITNAKNHIENKDYNTAVIELKNAIKKDKTDPEPRTILGEIYLMRGEYSAARKELSMALKYSSNNIQTELYLARALLGDNDIKAIEELVHHSETKSLNVKSELLSINALALIRNNKLNRARSILHDAEMMGFSGVYFNLAQAQLLAQNSKYDNAVAILKKTLTVHPNNIETLLLTAHVLSAQSEHEETAEIYRKILASAPDNPNYQLYFAQSLVKSEKYSEAEPYVNDILKLVPSHLVANNLKASIEYSKSNFKDARRHANAAIREGSNNIGTYVIAGICAYLQNDYEDAYLHLKEIAPYLKEDHFLQQLFVASQFKIGKINEAIESINDFDLSNKEYNNFATRMSLEFSSIGRSSDALAIAKKAEQFSTQSGQLRIGLLRAANNEQDGIKQLESILKVKPDQLEANIGLAYYHLSNGNIKKGEDVIDKWLESNNKDITALLLKGYLSLKKEKYNIAESMFNRALSLDKDNIKAKLSLLQLQSLNGDTKTAFDETFLLAKQYPDNFTVAMFLYRFAAQTDRIDDIISFYTTLIDADTNSIKYRLLLARIYASIQQSDKGIALLEELPSIQHSADVWSIKTLLYFQALDYRKAFQAAEEWVKLDRSNPEAYLRVIQLSESTKNYNKGIQYALDAEKLFIEHPHFTLMRATLLQLDQQPTRSQAVLDALPEKVKQSSYFLKLQSEVYRDRKDYNKSVLFAHQRYEKYPTSITAKDLALAYIADDQYRKATNLLKQRISKNPESEGALHLLLAQIQYNVEPNAAIETYISILEREPQNVIVLNNVAWLYINSNDLRNACQYATKAYNNAPNNPEIQDTYGYCLLKSGKHKESMIPLKMAYDGRNNNIEISFHYAESLILNNHLEKARRILDRVKPENNEHYKQHRQLYKQTK